MWSSSARCLTADSSAPCARVSNRRGRIWTAAGAAEGHLVVFDRTEGRPWDEKVLRREKVEGGAPVTV